MQNVVFAGCGAVGSRMALESGRVGTSYLLIDDDRVDFMNVQTGSTIFWRQHVGAFKTWALSEMLARRFGALAVADTETLTPARMRHYNYFAEARVVVDGFDNVEARRLTMQSGCPVLHVGVSASGTGVVAWDDKYELPDAAPARGDNPVCTHALGREIITFTATVGAVFLADWLYQGIKRPSVITTRDLSVIKF